MVDSQSNSAARLTSRRAGSVLNPRLESTTTHPVTSTGCARDLLLNIIGHPRMQPCKRRHHFARVELSRLVGLTCTASSKSSRDASIPEPKSRRRPLGRRGVAHHTQASGGPRGLAGSNSGVVPSRRGDGARIGVRGGVTPRVTHAAVGGANVASARSSSLEWDCSRSHVGRRCAMTPTLSIALARSSLPLPWAAGIAPTAHNRATTTATTRRHASISHSLAPQCGPSQPRRSRSARRRSECRAGRGTHDELEEHPCSRLTVRSW